MKDFELSLESMLAKLNSLSADSKPLWGNMSAQRMVEHLSDMLYMSIGKGDYTLLIDAEKIPSMQRFLESDKPMAKNIEVPFANKEESLRNEELELAIDEFIDAFLGFEDFYDEKPEATSLHPFYGDLNYHLWKRLHTKHFAHHFEQFSI